MEHAVFAMVVSGSTLLAAPMGWARPQTMDTRHAAHRSAAQLQLRGPAVHARIPPPGERQKRARGRVTTHRSGPRAPEAEQG
eukprot:scaffold5213_cov113-Isochrysis_galbana.AAC.4